MTIAQEAMYAVIETGGKQYRVELGSVIQVDRLAVQPGESITIDRVLLVADGDATTVGQPVVDGATVRADVLAQERGKKIDVFKYKPKARTRVKQGFRAELTRLRVADIAYAGRSAADDAKASETHRVRAAKEAQQAAADKATSDQELAARLAASEQAETADADQPSEPSAARVADEAESGGTAKAKPAKARTTKKAAAMDDAPEAETDAQAAPATAADAATETEKDD
jgi:large subunit ribosomal protein L21